MYYHIIGRQIQAGEIRNSEPSNGNDISIQENSDLNDYRTTVRDAVVFYDVDYPARGI